MFSPRAIVRQAPNRTVTGHRSGFYASIHIIIRLIQAGGGIRGGQIYGASDAIGAFPASDPVSPRDVLATVYRALGINHHSEIHDQLDRPWRLTEGHPLTTLFS